MGSRIAASDEEKSEGKIRRYESPFQRFDWRELQTMLQIAVPSILQQSTVSIGMLFVQAVVNPFGTQALAGYSATMRVENVFSLNFPTKKEQCSPMGPPTGSTALLLFRFAPQTRSYLVGLRTS